MFERFTDRARQVIILAQEEARDHHRTEVDCEHLVAAMVHEGEGLAAKIINAPLDQARKELFPEGIDHHTPMRMGHLSFTRPVKRCIEFAYREALALGHNYVGTEHLLLGVLRYESQRGQASVVDDFLNRHGVTLLSAKQHFAGLSAGDYAGAGRNILMRELMSLDRRIDRKTAELRELQTSRNEVARHLAEFEPDAARTAPA